MSADRPLFVDWSAHCAGEWRPFAGATLVADPGGPRTHPVSWVALGSHANLPTPRDRTPALVELRPARGDVRAPARPGGDRRRSPSQRSAAASTTRSASSTAPGAGTPQAFPLALVNRTTWPMTFPGIWGGRERIEVGPTGRTLGWSPPTPTLQPLWRDPLTTIFGDASRSRGRWSRGRRSEGVQGYGDADSPPPGALAHPRSHRTAESRRGRALHRPRLSLGLQLRADAARAGGALRRPAERAHGDDRPLGVARGLRRTGLQRRGDIALAPALPPARHADGDLPPARGPMGTGPACRLVKAAERQGVPQAEAVLRALRFGWFTTDLVMDEPEALRAVAESVDGLDAERALADAQHAGGRGGLPARPRRGALARALRRQARPHRRNRRARPLHRAEPRPARGRERARRARLPAVRGRRRARDEPRAAGRAPAGARARRRCSPPIQAV